MNIFKQTAALLTTALLGCYAQAEQETLVIEAFLNDEVAVNAAGKGDIEFINVSKWQTPIAIEKDLGDGRFQFSYADNRYVIDGLFVTTSKTYDVDVLVQCRTDIKVKATASTRGAGKNDCIKE